MDKAWCRIVVGRGVGVLGTLTCIRRPVVTANVCGFMGVGWHHLIVVLIRAVDSYLGSRVKSNAQGVPGLDLVLTPSFSCGRSPPQALGS